MREIKFRAWDKKNNRWVDPQYSIYPEYMIGGYIGIHMGVDIELVQYTGLKDKNGREIYENDIVRWSDGDYKHPSNPRIAEVRFAPDLGFWAVNVDGGYWFGFSSFAYKETDQHIEVIGNIYENPELLKL